MRKFHWRFVEYRETCKCRTLHFTYSIVSNILFFCSVCSSSHMINLLWRKRAPFCRNYLSIFHIVQLIQFRFHVFFSFCFRLFDFPIEKESEIFWQHVQWFFFTFIKAKDKANNKNCLNQQTNDKRQRKMKGNHLRQCIDRRHKVAALEFPSIACDLWFLADIRSS